VATLVGCTLAWAGSESNPLRLIGLPVPVVGWLRPVAPYAWFVAFGAAGALYTALMLGKKEA
jgi:hypothetical protein